jgi:hypothetical protein
VESTEKPGIQCQPLDPSQCSLSCCCREVIYRIDMTEFGTSLGLVRDNVIRMFDKGRPEV